MRRAPDGSLSPALSVQDHRDISTLKRLNCGYPGIVARIKASNLELVQILDTHFREVKVAQGKISYSSPIGPVFRWKEPRTALVDLLRSVDAVAFLDRLNGTAGVNN